MTEVEPEAAEKKRRWKKTLFALVFGGAFGFVGARLVGEFMDMEALSGIGASEEIAALVGMVYVVTGIIIAIGLISPKAGATYLNVEDADEIEEQRGMLMYSAAGMFIAGLALIVVAVAGRGGLVDPDVALGVYIVSSIAAVWVSIASVRKQDELMRAMGKDTAAMGYYLVLLIGGTWALLAHLGYVSAPAPLDWLTMFWSLMLLAAFIVTAKRGMMVMR